ncbi:MAG TPA: DUF4421 domain-containing protein [Chitinophagaceae bacterium]
MNKYVFAFSCGLLLLVTATVQAQKEFPHDTSYYETYFDKLTTRIYASQKYVKFTIPSSGNIEDVEYNANTKLNLGMGVTWHNYSLNVFYGFSFLNKNNDIKGKTKGLDLQLHLYPRKWSIDLLAVFPKGYYLYPQGYAAANSNSYYTRPDVKMTLLGVSAYQVPNKKKFSYRAALVQNEWQKKSAGSLLYGGEICSATIQGDSTLVPKSVQSSFPQAGINKINFLSVGPAIGYAYTVVMAQHFFITGSVIGNLDINFTKESLSGVQKKKTGINPVAVYKAAIGYNSSNWSISANIAGNAVWAKSAASPKDYLLKAGAYRLALAKKFTIHRRHHS